jgi:phosphate transport system substrate-binding protein
MFLSRIGITEGKPNGSFAMYNSKEVAQYVANDTNAIGVIPYLDLMADDSLPGDQVRIMAVADSLASEAVLPTLKTIGRRTYPLVLGIYVLSREARAGLGTGFTAFLNSDKGQRIILRTGLSPASMPPQSVNLYGTY